jgi:hypothetical protein
MDIKEKLMDRGSHHLGDLEFPVEKCPAGSSRQTISFLAGPPILRPTRLSQPRRLRSEYPFSPERSRRTLVRPTFALQSPLPMGAPLSLPFFVLGRFSAHSAF